jgi:hypothetical protein
VNKAVQLIKKSQDAPMDGGRLRLHKIASNSTEVLGSFPAEDLSKDLKELDFTRDTLPVQRSLGMSWDVATDCITYRVSDDIKAFTRRGVLSTINSLFDPIGFVAPVVLQGKLLLRDMMNKDEALDWDDPLPPQYSTRWEAWSSSLYHLENLKIPRTYSDIPFSRAERHTVHIFSDAVGSLPEIC